jgi:citrate lyase subunit beta/citryl-CoA lyase
LFVPGDRPDRMEKAFGLGADALILDLEDSVAVSAKASARAAVADFLARPERSTLLFVRINPLERRMHENDLNAIISGRPDGIMLPKAEGRSGLVELDRRLTAFGDSQTRVLLIAAESPAGILKLNELTTETPRLEGITWGAEDLSASVGATSSRDDNGRLTPPFELARSMTLFAATAARVAPIETVYAAYRDLDGLAGHAARAAQDGFTGMMAIHPTQVSVINAAFTPSARAVAEAEKIVEAFRLAPGVGVLSLDGKMFDAPHLIQAKRVLSRAKGA